MKDVNRLSNTVGDRINDFDTFLTQVVGNFNAQFPECPIKGYDVETPVAIGEVAPNNCRVLFIDGEPVVHKMYSDILYTLDRDVYNNKWEDEDDLTDMQGHLIYG